MEYLEAIYSNEESRLKTYLQDYEVNEEVQGQSLVVLGDIHE
ncbi:hypothetical protein NSU02_17605 [Aeribacillus sp. FSL W8-0870]|jgi:hypothetical protein